MGFLFRTCSWRRILLLLVIIGVCAVRIRLREIPLDRDEGEYAYAGQLILQGVPPYQLAYNMKLPGTYAVYAAVFAMFGESIQAIHLGLLLANLATIVLVACIGKHLFGSNGGLCSGVVYAVLACTPNVLGLAGNASHFVVLAAMSRTFRKRLTEVNEIEGRRKAFLFEILNGIATIKTLALEPRSLLRWRRHTDEAASAACRSITPRRAPAASSPAWSAA